MSAPRMIALLTSAHNPRAPAKKPETTPRTTPPTKATTVEISAIVRSMRGAAMTREKMSMPEMSVPIQWSTLGGRTACPGSASSGR